MRWKRARTSILVLYSRHVYTLTAVPLPVRFANNRAIDTKSQEILIRVYLLHVKPGVIDKKTQNHRKKENSTYEYIGTIIRKTTLYEYKETGTGQSHSFLGPCPNCRADTLISCFPSNTAALCFQDGNVPFFLLPFFFWWCLGVLFVYRGMGCLVCVLFLAWGQCFCVNSWSVFQSAVDI